MAPARGVARALLAATASRHSSHLAYTAIASPSSSATFSSSAPHRLSCTPSPRYPPKKKPVATETADAADDSSTTTAAEPEKPKVKRRPRRSAAVVAAEREAIAARRAARQAAIKENDLRRELERNEAKQADVARLTKRAAREATTPEGRAGVKRGALAIARAQAEGDPDSPYAPFEIKLTEQLRTMAPESEEAALSRMHFDHLPPRSGWKEAYPVNKNLYSQYRYFASNRDTISTIVEAMQIGQDLPPGLDATVIEAYPGPGTFTSELVRQPRVEKVIAMEKGPRYLTGLRSLQEQLEQRGQGSKLDIVEESGYDWATYNTLIDEGRLDHLQGRVPGKDGSKVDFSSSSPHPLTFDDESWQGVSPLFFFAQLPNTVHGEQLFAQIVHAIASRIWLYKYGRVRLGIVCGEALAKRCVARVGDRFNRGKLGTTVQSLSEVELLADASSLHPHGYHFFPPTLSMGPRVTLSGTQFIPNSNTSTSASRSGLCAFTLTPHQDPLVKHGEIEAFEFVTRNMFVLRSKSVSEAMMHIAPGGQNVLKMISRQRAEMGLLKQEEVIDPETKVVDLTNVQWAALARTFEKWPFRPEHLFEVGRMQTEKR